MITSFKGRKVIENQKVYAFWNLHLNVFSLQANVKDGEKRRNLVLAHGNNIILTDCKFIVRKSGREKVIRDKQKNIHAFVKGEYKGSAKPYQFGKNELSEAYYNPYKQDCFTDKKTGEKLEKASIVLLIDKKIYYK